jgi:hypothetical protein
MLTCFCVRCLLLKSYTGLSFYSFLAEALLTFFIIAGTLLLYGGILMGTYNTMYEYLTPKSNLLKNKQLELICEAHRDCIFKLGILIP